MPLVFVANIYGRFLITGLLVFGLMLVDFWTKNLAIEALDSSQIISVLPFMNLRLAWNTGVSFSLLSTASPLLLISFSMAISLGLFTWAGLTKSRLIYSGLILIVSGACGNIYDRLTYKAVCDFIDLFIGTYHWPTFNVADIYIVCGAILLIIDSRP
jgi:signal peptidase II